MPLNTPVIDDRRYQDLVRDALARVPVHTPEWTQLGESDPGVTLVELFAFLTESLLYRANRVPEVSRGKFLRLLGLPLAPAAPARGLVTLRSERPDPRTETVLPGTELRAGQVAFRMRDGIDVLPVEARAYVKFAVTPDDAETEYYRLLYTAAQAQSPDADLTMYETRALDARSIVDLARDTVDGALWIALLRPKGSDPDAVRAQLAGRTLSLGLVPSVDDVPKTLGTTGAGGHDAASALVRYELPAVDATSPGGDGLRQPAYRVRDARSSEDVLAGPAVVEIPMPAAAAQIDTWRDLDPLEAGVGDFPPAIEDSALADRVLTWLRVVPSASARARFLWAGVNAARVEQRVAVRNELLGEGDGRTDQVFRLARAGVVEGSVRLDVLQGGTTQAWQAIDDLMAAGPEVRAADSRRAPGQAWRDPRPAEVFLVDEEAGVLRFGDGLRGRRPAAGARLVAHYDTCDGALGNVPEHAITGGPALPPGMKADNPVPTWGGADKEDVADGERRVAHFIRHQDRLVTADDFVEIARRAPGVDLARVEVLPAYHPDLGASEPGDAPGAVTLMVVPRNDPRDPLAPAPDRALLDALCRHLDPRRLVTTELVLRGPDYQDVWISLGITVAGGFTVPDVRDRVKRRLLEYLAPARDAERAREEGNSALALPGMEDGWPLRKSVHRLELLAEASREPGVLRVDELLLSRGSEGDMPEVPMAGLQLPRVAGLAVEAGSAQPLDALRGRTSGDTTGTGANGQPRRVVPVPVVPQEC
ncbi:baseplate J/gp47 family protein [Ramlibacter sp. USB13]|uniref:Baseplate J/gp47 family protein n=1 Tax=Ramlibacter cellulosilyticus TaxID=2764187 RepID=A0A923MRU3_9BURK|nr:baseplate J/gp47 family protein [Ramlibacter cellulosilyticus]MBC5783434.1 baseplate J/gp47 family protein [Ramlibacter cellulosilyticus]